MHDITLGGQCTNDCQSIESAILRYKMNWLKNNASGTIS